PVQALRRELATDSVEANILGDTREPPFEIHSVEARQTPASPHIGLADRVRAVRGIFQDSLAKLLQPGAAILEQPGKAFQVRGIGFVASRRGAGFLDRLMASHIHNAWSRENSIRAQSRRREFLRVAKKHNATGAR